MRRFAGFHFCATMQQGRVSVRVCENLDMGLVRTRLFEASFGGMQAMLHIMTLCFRLGNFKARFSQNGRLASSLRTAHPLLGDAKNITSVCCAFSATGSASSKSKPGMGSASASRSGRATEFLRSELW